MKKYFITYLLLLLVLTSFPCPAKEVQHKPGFSKPFMKLGRGVVNTISAPLELPNQMYLLSNHAHENSKYGVETASAAIEGFLMGGTYTFWRLGAGIYDLLTFPLPLPTYEFSLITPPYLTVSYKEYYGKEKRAKTEATAEGKK